jgi:hypothetical protein
MHFTLLASKDSFDKKNLLFLSKTLACQKMNFEATEEYFYFAFFVVSVITTIDAADPKT